MCSKEIGIALAQRIAAAACRDGLHDPTVARLSRLGTSGAHLHNAERDFHRWFGTEAELGFEMTPTYIKVPMVARATGIVEDVCFHHMSSSPHSTVGLPLSNAVGEHQVFKNHAAGTAFAPAL